MARSFNFGTFLWFLALSYCQTIHTLDRTTQQQVPMKREFVKLQTPFYKYGAKKPVVLRVQQFNVLADGLAALRPDLGHFSRVSRDALEWDYRKVLLLKELTQYEADIITLQECDHYYDFFLPELSQRGYVGYFAPKPTSACLEVSPYSDGCALFVKADRLQVRSIETKTLALSVAELGEGGEVLEDDKSIKAQNQVAIIAVCDILDPHFAPEILPPIIVSTTHLKSSKTAIGERYRQKGIQQTLKQVSKIYRTLEDSGRSPTVLLTGVFNAEPYNSMGYGPLTYRCVKSHHLEFRSVYNDDLPHALPSNPNQSYNSNSNNNSNNNSNSNSQPQQGRLSDVYTTWKARRDEYDRGKERVTKRCIDYIFYSTYKEGVVKNSERDLQQEQQRRRMLGGMGGRKVVAVSASQVAIAFFLRSVVYIFGVMVPVSSIFSASLDPTERLVIFLVAILGCSWFESIAEGSIFKPRLDANANTEAVEPASSPTSVSSSMVTFDSPKTILANVGRLSQKIEPLKLQQYGRPGFQAVKALELLSEEQMGTDLLPSNVYPSDHISICADLQILH